MVGKPVGNLDLDLVTSEELTEEAVGIELGLEATGEPSHTAVRRG